MAALDRTLSALSVQALHLPAVLSNVTASCFDHYCPDVDEVLASRQGSLVDAVGAAEALAGDIIGRLLNPRRLNRLVSGQDEVMIHGFYFGW